MSVPLGQHFLVDPEVRDRIVNLASIRAGESIVEIGPGRGVLTEALVETGASVCAVELDANLARNLGERFAGRPRFNVVRGDFLKVSLADLGRGPLKFVANLPYAVATPILGRILSAPSWTSAVLMFQKEVAERVTARPGCRDYGLLTLSVLARAKARLAFEVPPGAFQPRPKVRSAVVHLLPRESPWAGFEEHNRFYRVAKAAFSQRRKMAAGLIAAALAVERAAVERAMRSAGIKATARGEEISFEAYLRLARELSHH